MTKQIAAVCLALLVFGCGEPQTTSPAAATESEKPRYLTIVAAGDNLIHDIIYNAARIETAKTGEAGGQASLEGFNFDPSYAPIKGIVEKAGIAFVNQETVLGGARFGHSGYPVFNTPQDAGRALVNAGFDVVNHASNHTMDRGEGAVFGTMDFWDGIRNRGAAGQGPLVLGIFRNEEARKTGRRIIEKNGIKVGFLSYTYGLNGFTLPRDKPWLVALIDKETMAREIGELRPLCDLLVVSMHWGNEFRHDVSETQKDLAAFMAEKQVDLVIGHHPHVTGPVEILPRPGGGKLVVYYSLGDLLSHTQSDWTPDTITGALAYIRVRKDPGNAPGESGVQNGPDVSGGDCTITVAAAIPTVCHYGRERRSPFVTYPLWDYTEELASKHYKNKMTLEYLRNTARNIFGPRVLSREQYEAYETTIK